jgi:hypothetical protein
MAHYQLLYPSEYIAACDLHEKDTTVQIEKVEVETLVGTDGKKQAKPVLTFRGAKKRMVCCKTNAKTIAKQHGNDTDGWVGKKITIYPTTCQSFGETKECVRVRP